MQRILLRESQFVWLMNRQLLNENRESKNQRIARNLMRERGLSDKGINDLYNGIRNNIPNSRVCQYSYFPMITRMCLDGQIKWYDTQLSFDLNKTLGVIGRGEVTQQVNPNDMFNVKPQQFIDFYKKDVETYYSNVRNRCKELNVTPNKNYTIVKIDNSQEAAKYGDFTDWCVTHDNTMYDSYTHEGTGRFYFCLRSDYQSVPREIGEGCPLDDYGLSMIAVSVTENGDMNTITCRWNHENGGNDEIMDEVDLTKLIGINFFEAFPPYTDEEQFERGNITPNMALRLIAQGKSPEEVFYVLNEFNNMLVVRLNYKYNILNKDSNTYLYKEWYDNIKLFKDGNVMVRIGRKWNYVKEDGTYLCDKWYDNLSFFHDGFACVKLDDQYNFIKEKDGSILYNHPVNEWFDFVYHFRNDLAKVGFENQKLKYNFLKKDGTLLYDVNLDYISDFYNNGIAYIYKGNKINFIRTDGSITWDYPLENWFDRVKSMKDDTWLVELKGKHYTYKPSNGEIKEYTSNV